jgi:hypothetical protein
MLFPSLLRAGMNWMEPVPPDVIDEARARARARHDRIGREDDDA